MSRILYREQTMTDMWLHVLDCNHRILARTAPPADLLERVFAGTTDPKYLDDSFIDPESSDTVCPMCVGAALARMEA